MTREGFPAYAAVVGVASLALCLVAFIAGAGWAALAFPAFMGSALVVGWWMQ